MALGKKKEDVFYTLFKDYAHNLSEMGARFCTFLKTYPSQPDGPAILKEFEKECDEKKHTIIYQLNDSFVTPLDREDIFTLAEQMDDLADYMEDISAKLEIYDVKALRPESDELSAVICEVIGQIVELFNALPDSKNVQTVRDSVIAINRLENQGDKIFRRALTRLFREETDAVEVIKWKDLFEIFEDAIDAGEHLADTVEGILAKNA